MPSAARPSRQQSNKTPSGDTPESTDPLKTLSQQAYEDISCIALSLCNSQHAQMYLVTSQGCCLPNPVTPENDEGAMKLAAFAHTLLGERRLLVVPHTVIDPAFADHSSVTGEPHVRFCAGVSLTSAQGTNVGALFVIDEEPRQLYPDQLNALQALGRQVVSLLGM